MPRSRCLATCSSALLACLAFGSSACGDALQGSGYPGEPLIVIAGQVLIEEALPPPEGEVRVAVYWSSQGHDGVQHQQDAEVGTSFPALYTLTLYTLPPDEVFYRPPQAEHPMAIGVPIVYEDLDGDGGHDQGEPVLGGAQGVLVFYAAEAERLGAPPDDGGPGGDGDTGRPGPGGEEGELPEGYHTAIPQGDPCGDGVLRLELVDSSLVELVVGELWSFLPDMDCDDDVDEWGEL